LSWTVEDPKFFFLTPFQGHLALFLTLRRRTLRGSIAKGKAGEYLQFRFNIVVPGFYNAYRTFHGLDELEILIRAHLCLYQLMAPILENAVEVGLKEPLS
jgi:hypothetical protein